MNGTTNEASKEGSNDIEPFQVSDDVELWTIRLPQHLQLSDLEGLQLQEDGSMMIGTTFPVKGTDYEVKEGNKAENECFRVLVKKISNNRDSGEQEEDSSEDDVSDDDEEDNKKYLYPSNKSFSKHVNIVEHIPSVTETELAPRETPSTHGCTLKIAYESVPQRGGLKRRWVPIGGAGNSAVSTTTVKQAATASMPAAFSPVQTIATKAAPTSTTAPASRKRSASTSSSSSSDEEAKAAKKARKEAKKAKKEAKKAKKEAKKKSKS